MFKTMYIRMVHVVLDFSFSGLMLKCLFFSCGCVWVGAGSVDGDCFCAALCVDCL
jgi:hypothetical protein